ncbi:uncharacterized protein PHACADRAFT_33031 [Phanerochaete carnosa HHB-10118-sp]|uniref:Uncharacterized protein n=1 Tax=Phanerochaete carnosa (strain HHB-10118-sp) TaxID=650164 RepID=K5VUF8_PHACS|nr:uncharacterized protein PHACADRAFT_33031 [Phanerochaete carnosa HHB-10118-sp]EKM50219.1 hypothetical protein PHACADRAFT_33031 [Phanerochaete carnosa HHB-10118-sp]
MTPEAGEVLTIGDSETVIWNVSLVPRRAPNISRIDLYRNTTVGMADFTANLAENVDPRLGTVDYVVPDVEPGSYFVTIGDVEGASSDIFHIAPRDTTPNIIIPNTDTVWTAGGEGFIAWNASGLPAHPGPIKQFLLCNDPFHSGVVLASNIDPTLGNITVQVPADSTPEMYFIRRAFCAAVDSWVPLIMSRTTAEGKNPTEWRFKIIAA